MNKKLVRSFGITFNDIKYGVVVESFNDKIVRAIIYDTRDNPEPEKFVSKKFVGIARCHPNDKFDIHEGERWAISRAIKKRWKFFKSKIDLNTALIEKEEHDAANGILKRCQKYREKDIPFKEV